MLRHPTLAIVGAGRTGSALGALLRRRGWRVGCVVTRSTRTARAAVRAIGAGQPRARLTEDILAADVVLIATPDGAIASVAAQLARLGASRAARGSPWRGKVVLHVSGALDRSVLRPLGRRGAATGSLHPLQTFTGRGVPPLRGRICAIEGAGPARRTALRICRDLGSVPVIIAGRAKPAYHAAGALAAGHVLGVVEAATRVLMASGFSRALAQRALLPLTRQVLDNLARLGPRRAPRQVWTGPASRGDLATIAAHAAALRRFPAEYRAAYDALTRLAIRVLDACPAAKRRALDRALRFS